MSALAFEDERWRLADQNAAFLSVDRDVCRRAFYGETVNLISKVVECVRSWENDPEYEPERMIEDWAREVGAGVFDEDRRYKSDLTRVDKLASDEFLRLAFERPELDHKNDYHLYLVCVRIEEEKLGRQLTISELDRFTRRFYAPNYRRNLDEIPKKQWDELHSELEHEEPRTQQKRLPRRKVS